MNHKPWAIYIFVIIFLLIPIFNLSIIYAFQEKNLTFLEWLLNLFLNRSDWMIIINVILPCFVISFSLYMIKDWSIKTISFCMSWSMLYFIFDMTNHYTVYKIISPLVFFIVGGRCLYYILTNPEIKEVFMNHKMRWWETRSRFIIEENVRILPNLPDSEVLYARINNFSEGGLLFTTVGELPIETLVELQFKVLEQPFTLIGKIVHYQIESQVYGVNFIDLTTQQKKILHKVARELQKQNFPLYRQKIDWRDDLNKWWSDS